MMLKHRHTARQDVCRAPRVRPLGDARRIPTAQWPAPGIANRDVRRGLATKSSTPCKTLVYLVVHPSLIHIITLKYARTLHKRRPRDTYECNLRTLTRITVTPRALTCADMCAATCKRHICSLLEKQVTAPPTGVGFRPGGREGGGSRGRRRAVLCPPRACEGGERG